MDEDIAFFAFRYALGRKTYAVGVVADYLIENWHNISLKKREMICEEIEEAIEKGDAGYRMDVDKWRQVILLESAMED